MQSIALSQAVPQTLRIDQIGDEIGLLSGHLNAVNCRLLELIAQFNELGGYAEQGAKTCAHWLNWKCGFGLNAARERVRTAMVLPSFPKIHACFSAGRISYTKVRAMTRVATPENEDALLNIALHGTASHMEKLVRGYRKCIAVDEETQDEEKNREGRYCHYHWDDEGYLVIRARLTAEQGAIVMQAIEDGQDTLEENVTAVTSEHPPVLPPEPDDGDETAKSAAERMREKQALWHDRPKRRADAVALMAESLLAHGGQSMKGGDKHQILLIADADAMSGDTSASQCCLEHGPHVAAATLRRIGCDASRRVMALDRFGEPISIGRKSRTIPSPMRTALLLRDGGCRFPGCAQRRYVDGHHIEHWADGGETSLENLVTLCRHHHRLVHEDGFAVRRIGANRFEFKSPRGNVIPDAAPPPHTVTDLDVDITLLNNDLGVVIGEDTLGLWDGTRMDYSESVEQLQIRDGRFSH